MSNARSIVVRAFAVAAATLLFWLAVHQVSGLWLDVALRPEVRQALQESLDDQKRLRALDAENRERYHRRFETTRKLLHRLDIIRMNRREMLQRFEIAFVALFAIVMSAAVAWMWTRDRRARALERQQYLDRLAVLQDNAYRNAHETRGPLTAAQLELERAGDAVWRRAEQDEIATALERVAGELETLSRLTRQQTSFAAIGTPVLRRESLGAFIEEFCATFASAWPDVTLRFTGGDGTVCADRDMLRQVLMNLCVNSAKAISGSGIIVFSIVQRGKPVALDVSDNGGGIPESLRARVFDPYVTTRRMGEGMGLGLSISRKIMLDHGGDLQLVASSPAGTTFRLIFGASQCS